VDKSQELTGFFDWRVRFTEENLRCIKNDIDGVPDFMRDTGRELLKTGKTPQDVGSLAESASAVAGGEGSSPNNVAQTFNTAAKAVQSRPDMKPQEIAEVGKVVAQRFPGKDPTERMAAFESGTKMMGESASLNAKGIDAMLARGQEQGLRGEKLLRGFETQGQAMREGALSAATLQDKSSKNLSFDKDGKLQRERTSGQASPHQKMTRLGQEKAGDNRATPGERPAGGSRDGGPGGSAPGSARGAAPAPSR
jgi:hypothetical protein